VDAILQFRREMIIALWRSADQPPRLGKIPCGGGGIDQSQPYRPILGRPVQGSVEFLEIGPHHPRRRLANATNLMN